MCNSRSSHGRLEKEKEKQRDFFVGGSLSWLLGWSSLPHFIHFGSGFVGILNMNYYDRALYIYL